MIFKAILLVAFCSTLIALKTLLLLLLTMLWKGRMKPKVFSALLSEECLERKHEISFCTTLFIDQLHSTMSERNSLHRQTFYEWNFLILSGECRVSDAIKHFSMHILIEKCHIKMIKRHWALSTVTRNSEPCSSKPPLDIVITQPELDVQQAGKNAESKFLFITSSLAIQMLQRILLNSTGWFICAINRIDNVK